MTDFKQLVLGNAGKKKVRNPLKGKKAAKKKSAKRKKGSWNVMYGGSEDEELKKKRNGGNFWVDTSTWF